jgi:hypothetical protein
MGEKKTISIVLVLLIISLIPIAIAAENQTDGSIVSSGYGTRKIFGIHPRVSGDNITLFMVLPFFGRITIDKPYFNGHIGIFLIYGDYNWVPNGPPSYPTALH